MLLLVSSSSSTSSLMATAVVSIIIACGAEWGASCRVKHASQSGARKGVRVICKASWLDCRAESDLSPDRDRNLVSPDRADRVTPRDKDKSSQKKTTPLARSLQHSRSPSLSPSLSRRGIMNACFPLLLANTRTRSRALPACLSCRGVMNACIPHALDGDLNRSLPRSLARVSHSRTRTRTLACTRRWRCPRQQLQGTSMQRHT